MKKKNNMLIFQIIKKKKNKTWELLNTSVLAAIVIALLGWLFRVIGVIQTNESIIFIIVFMLLLFLYMYNEQYIMPKLFSNIGSVEFGNKLKIHLHNKYYEINYIDIEVLQINYNNYRHWISAPYILRREDGADNSLHIRFKGEFLQFSFLSLKYNDKKRLKAQCYSLYRKDVPIRFYVQDNEIVISKSKKMKM